MAPYTKDELRQPARIASVFRGQEDHGIWTVLISLEGPTGGWSQGFGQLCLKDETETHQFLQEVCDVFEFSDPMRLKGAECFALYSESPWSSIEGIEAPNGRRFTIKGYRRRHYPKHAPTPTQAKRDSLLRDIAFHERRAAERRVELEMLGELVDWDMEVP